MALENKCVNKFEKGQAIQWSNGKQRQACRAQ